ncbi:MAG: hypothetical protein ABI651_07050, partial [Verrucomicrobiota bacterium]
MCGVRLDDLAPAPFDSGERDFHRNILAVRSAGKPLETNAAPGHAFFDIFGGYHSGSLSAWLERRRQITRVFTQQLLRALAAKEPHGGGINLQELVLVMENHSVARTFKQRAKLLFRFTQGAFRAFALRVVHDAGANQILAFRRQAQQPDFGRNQPAIGLLLMDPFEDRHSSRQGFSHQFACKLAGATSTRLKFRADIGGSQLCQLFHRYTIKMASVFVPEEKPSGVPIENDDGFRGMLDQGAEARFTRAECGRALGHPALKGLVQFN